MAVATSLNSTKHVVPRGPRFIFTCWKPGAPPNSCCSSASTTCAGVVSGFKGSILHDAAEADERAETNSDVGQAITEGASVIRFQHQAGGASKLLAMDALMERAPGR